MLRLLENLAHVRQRIADAARRSGRSPEDVTLLAVTKYVGDDAIADLVAAGCLDLGESRPQALWAKALALSQRTGQQNASAAKVRWHLVGHLQRNKIAQTLPLVSRIHSVDSLRLLTAIHEAAASQGRRQALPCPNRMRRKGPRGESRTILLRRDRRTPEHRPRR